MATNQASRPHQSDLTPEQQARVESIRAENRSPAARAEQAREREALDREYRETGTIKTTGDGTTMGDLVTFRRFIMSLRRERESQGLSLADVAERANIDKGALSRLENGQQLNPTVNTLERYARAIGKSLAWGVVDERFQDQSFGAVIGKDRLRQEARLWLAAKDAETLERLLQVIESKAKSQ